MFIKKKYYLRSSNYITCSNKNFNLKPLIPNDDLKLYTNLNCLKNGFRTVDVYFKEMENDV